MPLLVRIIIAIAAGIGAGMIVPGWLARCFATFNSVFSAFLGFLIPLLIVGFVAPAIAELGRKAGKMLIATAAIAYSMTFAVGAFAYLVASSVFPSLISGSSYSLNAAASASAAPEPWGSFSASPAG